MIKVKRELTVSDVEKLYDEIATSKDATMLIPKETKELTFFVLPSLMQVIVTLLRRHEGAKILFNVDKTKEDVHYFAEQYLWFMASSLAWRNNGVWDVNGENIKEIIRPINETIHKLMNDAKKIKGNSLLIASFDQLPRNRGLSKIFYNEASGFVPEANIEQHIYKIFQNLGAFFNRQYFSKLTPLISDISSIIYELYKNTHQWAIKDHAGNYVDHSLRAVYFRIHQNLPTAYDQYAGNNHLLRQYLLNNRHTRNTKGQITFLEISIFDSGDGFVGQLLGKEREQTISVEEEVLWVKRCLLRNFTSEEGKNKDTKGIGLDRVLTLLNDKGFLRIRTNRVCVCRDLIADRYTERNNPNEVKLFDWNTCDEFEFSNLSPCEGTIVSIVLPINA